MKKNLMMYGVLIAAFTSLAAVVFRCAWGADHVFSGSDLNLGMVARMHRVLPEVLGGIYYPSPLLGFTANLPVKMLTIGMWVLPPDVFTSVWYAFYLVLSTVFFIAYCRLWNLRWLSCAAGALAAFWVGSVTLSAAGHANKLGVMAWFCIALYLFEKAIRTDVLRKRLLFSCLTGIASGFMLLEQQDVGLLAGLFLGAYALFRLSQCIGKKIASWAVVLGPIAAIALIIAAPSSLKAYHENVLPTGQETSASERWNFITQWSMVPRELSDLVAPGYRGWSTGNPEGPYWGEIGQSAEWKTTGQGFRNFRLDSIYIGILPVFLSLMGLFFALKNVKRQKGDAVVFVVWGVLALAALFLSFGKFSVLYKAFYHLPLVGNIRAPIKFLHNLQVIMGILSAYGLNELLNINEAKQRMIVRRLFFVTIGMTGLFALLSFVLKAPQDPEMGNYVDVMNANVRNAWLHAAGMSALLGGLFYMLAWKPEKLRKELAASILILALAADSVVLAGHYFKATDISGLKEGNAVLNYLIKNQGDERIAFANSSGPYNGWLAMEGSYYGLNFFDIWQMPRMSQEYKNYLGAAGNDRLRLWQLTSCKYITAPAGAMNDPRIQQDFLPVMLYRFALQDNRVIVLPVKKVESAQDQVLLESRTYVPRFALYSSWEKVPRSQQCQRLFSEQFNPLDTVVVDDDVLSLPEPGTAQAYERVRAETNLKEAVVQSRSERGGVLMFTQLWQSDWRVEIDGQPAELLHCNYLCMGVYVPAGDHTVRFHCN